MDVSAPDRGVTPPSPRPSAPLLPSTAGGVVAVSCTLAASVPCSVMAQPSPKSSSSSTTVCYSYSSNGRKSDATVKPHPNTTTTASINFGTTIAPGHGPRKKMVIGQPSGGKYKSHHNVIATTPSTIYRNANLVSSSNNNTSRSFSSNGCVKNSAATKFSNSGRRGTLAMSTTTATSTATTTTTTILPTSSTASTGR